MFSGLTLLQFRQLEASLEKLVQAEQHPLSCALLVANTIEDRSDRSIAMARIAGKYAEAGQHEQALQLLSEAQEIAKANTSPDIKLLCAIAGKYAELGQPEQASQILSHALHIEQTVVRTYDSVVLSNSRAVADIGCAYVEMGDFDYALEVANTIESASYQSSVISDIVRKYAEIGQKEQAAKLVPQILKTYRTTKWRARDKSRALVDIAHEYAKNGQEEQAAQLLSQAYGTAKSIIEADVKAAVLADIAGKYAKNRQKDQATKLLSQVFETVEPIHTIRLRSNALFEVAVKYAEIGEFDQALKTAETIDHTNYTYLKFDALVKIAREYAKAGDFNQAFLVAQAIDDASDKSEVLVEIAGKCVEVGKKKLAAQILSQAYATAQTRSANHARNVLREIAETYAKLGDLNQALKTVKAMESTEDKALILAVIAGECVEIGQTEEAGHMLVQAFERAKTIKDASLDSKVLRTISETAVEAGDFNLALQAVEMMESNDQYSGLTVIAGKYVQTGQREQALMLLSEAIETAKTIKYSDRPKALFEIAVKYFEIGQKEQGEQLLSRALNAATIHEDRLLSDEVLHELAVNYAKAGDFDQALKMARSMGQHTGGRPGVLAELAGEYGVIGQTEQAARLLSEALQSAQSMLDSGEQTKALVELAGKYAELGQQEKAVKFLSQVREVTVVMLEDYNKWGTLRSIAGNYAQAGDFNQAIKTVELIERSRGAYRSSTLVEIAGRYIELKQYEEASLLLSQALDITQTSTKIPLWSLTEIAGMYAQTGQQQQASQLLKQALEIANTTEDAWLRSAALISIADEYAKHGQQQQTEQLLIQAIETVNLIEDTWAQPLELAEIACRYADYGYFGKAFEVVKMIEAVKVTSGYEMELVSGERSRALICIVERVTQLSEDDTDIFREVTHTVMPLVQFSEEWTCERRIGGGGGGSRSERSDKTGPAAAGTGSPQVRRTEP